MRCLEHDACFYKADESGSIAVFPHVIGSLGHYLSAQAGLPVPYAVPTQGGEALRELAGKPALLQPRLAGKHVSQPNAHHCAEIGAWLARLHLATREHILERRSDPPRAAALCNGRQRPTPPPGRAALLLFGDRLLSIHGTS